MCTHSKNGHNVKLIQSAFKRKGELMRKPMEVVMFKLLTSPHPHLELLQDHRDQFLRTCSPLSCGDGGIEDAFQTLFCIKMKSKHSTARSLSATIMILGLQYDYIL